MSTQRTPRQRLKLIIARVVALAVFAGVLVLNNFYGLGYTGVDRSGPTPKITAHIILFRGTIVVRDVSNATTNPLDVAGKWYTVVPDGLYVVSGHGTTPSDWYGFLIGSGRIRNQGVIRLWYLWYAAAAIVAILTARDALTMRRDARSKNRICLRCGYSLDGISGKCPECGNDRLTAS